MIAACLILAASVCRAPDVYPVSVTTNAAGHVLVDFGKHAFGWLEANVTATGAYDVIWGELLDAQNSVQTNRRYTVTEGTIRCAHTKGRFEEPGVRRIPYAEGLDSSFNRNRLDTFGTVMPFRWVEVIAAPFPIERDSFRQIPVSYPYDPEEEHFSSSSPDLDRVHDFCKHSVSATSFAGMFVDGDRERLPYEADSYITQLGTYAISSDATLVSSTIDHLENNETWPTEWKQFFIRMCWADWMRSGSTNRISRCYDVLKSRKLWLQLARETDKLLISACPETEVSDGKPDDICDWGRCYRDGFVFRPVNSIVNALHYRNLLEMSDIARAIGKSEDAKFFASRADQVRRAFAAVLIDPCRGIVRDGEGANHFTVQANAMALACGIIPEQYVKTVSDYIVKRGMSCSTYMAQFVLEALGVADRTDDMLALITTHGKRGWIAMMDKGATITTEFWDLTLQEPGRVPDMNHAWSTAPLNVISRYVLGVSPIEPGYGKIRIRPQFGSLERVRAIVPTPKGLVKLETWAQEGRRCIRIVTPVPSVCELFDEHKEVEAGEHVFREKFPPVAAEFEGKPLELHPLTLSACPLNQVWPGYQRPKKQTKRGWFVNFDVDRSGWLALVFSNECEASLARDVVRIRPLSRKVPVRVEGRRFLVRVKASEQFAMEFPGVSEEVHVFSNQPMVPMARKSTRRFSPGIHHAGLICPRDDEMIIFEPGAYVYGSVVVDGAKNVTITGRGVLDSSQMVRTDYDHVILENQVKNIRLGKGKWDVNGSAFLAYETENLHVDGIVLVDSPFWAMTFRDCRNTVVDNVKIVGQWRYNADGIDVCDSRDTVIRNSFVRSFDDCIVARGAQLESKTGVLDGMSVENCVLWCDWGKNLEIWGGGRGGAIKNVTYRDCSCVETSHIVADVTVKGVSPKIACENILFSNIEVDAVEPLLLPQLQKRENPNERYSGGLRKVLDLVRVECCSAESTATNVRFAGVCFERFHVHGVKIPPRVQLRGEGNGISFADVKFSGFPHETQWH